MHKDVILAGKNKCTKLKHAKFNNCTFTTKKQKKRPQKKFKFWCANYTPETSAKKSNGNKLPQKNLVSKKADRKGRQGIENKQKCGFIKMNVATPNHEKRKILTPSADSILSI